MSDEYTGGIILIITLIDLENLIACLRKIIPRKKVDIYLL